MRILAEESYAQLECVVSMSDLRPVNYLNQIMTVEAATYITSSIVVSYFQQLSSFAHMAASNVEDNVEEINDVGRDILAAVEFIFRAQDLVSLCTGF